MVIHGFISKKASLSFILMEYLKTKENRNSLAVQLLRLGAFNAKGPCSIPGGGAKIPHAAWCSQKETKNPTNQTKNNENTQQK